MVQFEGKYKLKCNENLNAYFKEVGVPCFPRKMVCMSSPTLRISKNDEEWKIEVKNLFSKAVFEFKLNEEYEAKLPGGMFKNVTTLEGNTFITKSRGPQNAIVTRLYEISDEGCIMVYQHDKTGVVAKRYFIRV